MYTTDVIVLIFSLVAISVIGLVHSRRIQNTTAREVMIGSGVSVWSAAFSVCSGFISSISLLGFPSEIYYQGSMIAWYGLMYCFAFPVVAYIFLPVIYNLKLTTLYEYFERRFCLECHIICLILFCIQTLLYSAVALYAPSLAISTLTGVSLHISIILTAFLAALYISVGGARAGIITSALQMVLIIFCMCVIVFISAKPYRVSEIVELAWNAERLRLNDFRIDPRIRHSFWSLFIGGTGNILCLFAANQLSVQKYMAMPTLKQAQRVVLLNIFCNIFILCTYILAGILIFVTYKDCHPILENSNEIFPRFVSDTLSTVPGAVGLFAAAVYSAGLSTLSASFSALSTVLVNDVWKLKRKLFQQTSAIPKSVMNVSRILPFILAALTILLACLFSYLESLVLQIALSVFGAVGGPVLGTLVIGLFVPFVRGRSASLGLVGSTVFCFIIALGALHNQIRPISLPLSGSCRNQSEQLFDNVSFGSVYSRYGDSLFVEFTKVSYQYYSVIGVIANIFLSVLSQLIAGSKHGASCDVTLLSPLVQRNTGEHHLKMELTGIN